MPNFSQIGQKIREAQILMWNDAENCFMTSYLPHSDDVITIIIDLRDFVPEYHPAKFGGNWTTNKGKTEGAQCPPAYMVPKDPSLNRVNGTLVRLSIKIYNFGCDLDKISLSGIVEAS